MGKCCSEGSDFVFRQIVTLADKEDSHKILDEFDFGSDQTVLLVFDWIFIKLAGNKGSLKISDEFDFGPDQTIRLVFDRIFV